MNGKPNVENGAVFTPSFIVNKILDDIGYNNADNILGKTILEPSCGDGNFLVEIVSRIVKYSPIDKIEYYLSFVHGFEYDKTHIEACKIRLNQLLLSLGVNIKIEWNIENINTIDKITDYRIITDDNIIKYDYIVGNPPYIARKHLDVYTKKIINTYFIKCYQNFDLYQAFMELSYYMINENGKIGFIVPSTWLKQKPSTTIFREWLTQNLLQVTDYKHIQLFGKYGTYTTIVIYDKTKSKTYIQQDVEVVDNNFLYKTSVIIKDVTQNATKDVNQSISNDITIHGGVQTGNDNLFVLDVIKYNSDTTLCKTSIGNIEIENGILNPCIKISRFHGELQDKVIIYPYIDDKLMTEDVIQKLYPNAWNYLLSVKDKMVKNKDVFYQYSRGNKMHKGTKIICPKISTDCKFHILNDTLDKPIVPYMGFLIKYKGNYDELLNRLNQEDVKNYLMNNGTTFSGGYVNLSKYILEKMLIELNIK